MKGWRAKQWQPAKKQKGDAEKEKNKDEEDDDEESSTSSEHGDADDSSTYSESVADDDSDVAKNKGKKTSKDGHGKPSFENWEAEEWSACVEHNVNNNTVWIFMSGWEMTDDNVVRWGAWFREHMQWLVGSKGKFTYDTFAKEIDFSNNELTTNGLQELFRVLRTCRVLARILKLHRNQLEDGIAIAEYIGACKGNLRELHLSHNRLTEDGAVEICNAAAILKYRGKFCYPCVLDDAYDGPVKVPLWLRFEQNFIDADTLVEQIEVCYTENKRSGKAVCSVRNNTCTSKYCGKCAWNSNWNGWDDPPALHLKYVGNQNKIRPTGMGDAVQVKSQGPGGAKDDHQKSRTSWTEKVRTEFIWLPKVDDAGIDAAEPPDTVNSDGETVSSESDDSSSDDANDKPKGKGKKGKNKGKEAGKGKDDSGKGKDVGKGKDSGTDAGKGKGAWYWEDGSSDGQLYFVHKGWGKDDATKGWDKNAGKGWGKNDGKGWGKDEAKGWENGWGMLDLKGWKGSGKNWDHTPIHNMDGWFYNNWMLGEGKGNCKGSVKDEGKGFGKNDSKGFGKDDGKGFGKNDGKGFGKDDGKGCPKGSSKNEAKGSGKVDTKGVGKIESSKGDGKSDGKFPGKDAGKDDGKDAGKGARKDAGNDACKGAGKEASKDASNDAGKGSGKAESKGFSKDDAKGSGKAESKSYSKDDAKGKGYTKSKDPNIYVLQGNFVKDLSTSNFKTFERNAATECDQQNFQSNNFSDGGPKGKTNTKGAGKSKGQSGKEGAGEDTKGKNTDGNFFVNGMVGKQGTGKDGKFGKDQKGKGKSGGLDKSSGLDGANCGKSEKGKGSTKTSPEHGSSQGSTKDAVQTKTPTNCLKFNVPEPVRPGLVEKSDKPKIELKVENSEISDGVEQLAEIILQQKGFSRQMDLAVLRRMSLMPPLAYLIHDAETVGRMVRESKGKLEFVDKDSYRIKVVDEDQQPAAAQNTKTFGPSWRSEQPTSSTSWLSSGTTPAETPAADLAVGAVKAATVGSLLAQSKLRGAWPTQGPGAVRTAVREPAFMNQARESNKGLQNFPSQQTPVPVPTFPGSKQTQPGQIQPSLRPWATEQPRIEEVDENAVASQSFDLKPSKGGHMRFQ